MKFFYDRTKETTVTTGTGAITLAGAVSQFRAFSASYLNGSGNIPYVIVGQTGTEWESGNGTLVNATTFSRDRVVKSSNANALVNFSAGTKDVWVDIHEEDANQMTMIGLANAMAANNNPIM